LKIHEYQAKSILAEGGVPVPKGGVATTPQEAREIAAALGGTTAVKAQVHAGGRGKAGGIKMVSSAREAELAAASLLGTSLVTFQTGPEGVPVRSVLVEEALDVGRELYVGMVIDGAAEAVVVMASESGGMDIEEVAEKTPERLLRVEVDPVLGLQPYQGRKIAYGLNLGPEQIRPATAMMANLYTIFESNDCSLLEINPLVVTGDGRLLAADAKLNIDDDALYRHPKLQGLRDAGQEDPLEARAREADVSYVKLDGNVGCMVNGAGLAMATMDVIGASGAGPANFLDVGGRADQERVAQALTIILSDPNVTSVFINIFGGILRCDIVARGVIEAVEAMPVMDRPMVVRMLGTNAEAGRELLANSDLDVTIVDDMYQAAAAIEAAG
jgi:succinyl-CoA synthetase beta subunit